MLNKETGPRGDERPTPTERLQETVGGLDRSAGPLLPQQRELLRAQLDREAERIMTEYDASVIDMEDAVATRVEARVLQLLQQEIRRQLDKSSRDDKPPPDTRDDEPKPPPREPGKGSRRWRHREPGHSSRRKRQPEPGLSRLFEDIAARGDEWGEDALPKWLGRQSAEADNPQQPTPDRSTSAPKAERVEGAGGVQEAGTAEDQVVEGTVRLVVDAGGDIGQVINFVRELHGEPEVRLLKMVSAREDGVDIWLALRQPVDLGKILTKMEDVSRVDAIMEAGSGSPESVLVVALREDDAETPANTPQPAQSKGVVA